MRDKKNSRLNLAIGSIMALFIAMPVAALADGGGDDTPQVVIQTYPYQVKVSIGTDATADYLADNGNRYPKGSTLVFTLRCFDSSGKNRASTRHVVSKTIDANYHRNYNRRGTHYYYTASFETMNCSDNDSWQTCMEFDPGAQKGPCRGLDYRPPKKVSMTDWQIYIND